ncbi:MAG: pantoate--beta-alanine ligase [Candidatus Tantalella remota]|nr:pantoate--beta-alanine ligase [Candidatus Tantalella remota]
MKIIAGISDMCEFCRGERLSGRTVGFVPTMGYLHEGHLSLIEAAKSECDTVVVSVFVNPTQFGEGEDLDKYPSDRERDESLASGRGADVLFIPSAEDMYPEGETIEIKADKDLAGTLCGRTRSGHFDGVVTVIAKLFNIVHPEKAYFGQKDAQQLVVIRRMVKDLDSPVEIRVMPIVRESDGLAMSSRNSYLTPEERQQALGLSRALEMAKSLVVGGEHSVENIKKEMLSVLSEEKDVSIDYIECVDADTLWPVNEVQDNILLAVAAFVGGTRLIDNIIINKGREDEKS